MLAAYVPTLVFLIACWYGLREQWPFPAVLVFAFGIWGALVALPYAIRRLL